MKNVLFSAPYMQQVVDRFRPVLAHYGVELVIPVVSERLSEEDLLAYAGQFDGTICGDDFYTPRVLQACTPRLKVISKWGTGIDSIDRQEAARLGIRVCNTPNAFTIPVSDNVLGYILTFGRRLPWMDRGVKAGVWAKIPGRALAECTLGVIGVGNIGKAVLRKARPFGMKLLANDIIEIAPDFVLENNVEMTALKDLLERSDFISLHTDLNPTSYHLINAQTLSWVKPGAVLINTSRGKVVDEPALVQALQSGQLAGAALDVYDVEPLPDDSPLRQMDQVMLAAHNANSSPLAWERVHWNTIRNLLDGLGIACPDLDQFRAKS
jgi:D-3-phosphoglycerate dehydrogenase